MRPAILFFLATLFLCITDRVAADGLGIAVVDMVRAFESHPRTAVATATLTGERNAARKTFVDLSNQLKAMLQKHQEQIRAGEKDDAVETLKEANELEKKIAALGTTGKRDLEERFREEKRTIIEEIREAVRRYNEKAEFDLVFDSSSASSTGIPQVLDAPGATDITDEVIALLREKQG